MSADSGIYILESLDGFRIITSQAIENVYYWYSCCENPNVHFDALVTIDDNLFHDKCINCGLLDPESEMRKQPNPEVLKEYFGKCTVYDTKAEVFEEATNIFEEYIGENVGGISFIRGWEDKFFPEY